MDYNRKLNDDELLESFMNKIEKVKERKGIGSLNRTRDELKGEFSVIKFSCQKLGQYLQDKFNGGNPFSLSDAEHCPLVISNDFFLQFENDTGIKGNYRFNEFKFFKKATVKPSDGVTEPVKNLTEITVPDEWNEIPAYCFYKYEGLKNVNYSENVTRFGKFCFSDCSNLKKVIDIPKSENLKNIGTFACKGTNIDHLYIPDTVAIIGMDAFCGCNNLEAVLIDNEYVFKASFALCKNLKTIELTVNVRKVEDNAFSNCPSIETVKVHSKVKFISTAFSNTLYGKYKPKFILYAPKDDEDYYSKGLSISKNISKIIYY